MIKLIHNDCFEIVEKIPDESIDLILTDIPYNISIENNFKTMKDRQGRTGIDFGEWDKNFDEQKLAVFTSKLKKGGSLFLFHSIEQYMILRDVFKGLEFKDKIIWEKTNPMPRNRERRYISNIEIGSWYVKGGAKWTFNRQNEPYDGSVYRFPSESGGGFKRYHPTQKNLKLIEQIILRHSNKGEIVLDPFMGGGTTGVACINTERDFLGIELDMDYYQKASDRIYKTFAVDN